MENQNYFYIFVYLDSIHNSLFAEKKVVYSFEREIIKKKYIKLSKKYKCSRIKKVKFRIDED